MRKLQATQVARARGRVRNRGRGPARGRARRRLGAARRARRRRTRDRRGGGRAGPARRRLDARLGHARDRGLGAGRRRRPGTARPSTCTASPTPATSGTIVRTAAALSGARVVLGPGSADAYSPKARAGEHGGAVRVPAGPRRARGHARARGSLSSPTAATTSTTRVDGARRHADALPRRRARRAFPTRSSRPATRRATIPLRGGRRVAQRRGGGGDRAAADIFARTPAGTADDDARADRRAARRGPDRDRGGAATPRRSRRSGSATSAARRS